MSTEITPQPEGQTPPPLIIPLDTRLEDFPFDQLFANVNKGLKRTLESDKARPADQQMSEDMRNALSGLERVSADHGTSDTFLQTLSYAKAYLAALQDQNNQGVSVPVQSPTPVTNEILAAKPDLSPAQKEQLIDLKKKMPSLPDPNEDDTAAWKKAFENIPFDELKDTLKELGDALESGNHDSYALENLLSQFKTLKDLKTAYSLVNNPDVDGPLLDTKVMKTLKLVQQLILLIPA